MTSFRVRLACFEGPLDLLVTLVRARELHILDLTLAEIASAFLRQLEAGLTTDLDTVGEFLVLTSILMEVKSRELIPNAPALEEPEETQTRQELVRQLLEYKRFKEAAALLWERAREHQQKLGRQSVPLRDEGRDPSRQPIRELELWDLVSAFSRLLKENIVPVADSIPRDPTPLPVYMDQLESRVAAAGRISFRDLLGTRNSRARLISKFLALLELIKTGRVWLEIDPMTKDLVFLPPAEPAAAAYENEASFPMSDTSVPPDVAPPQVEARDAWPPPYAALDDVLPSWDEIEAELDRSSDIDPPKRSSSSAAWADFEPLVDEPPAPEPDGDDPADDAA